MITRARKFLAEHPHIGHNLHHSLHVAYFFGVAVSNVGKIYALLAGALALVGAVSIWKGGDP
jgi:hypothetical protein